MKEEEKDLICLCENYKQQNVEKECETLIAAVLPDLKSLSKCLAAEYERPVVQYITNRVKTPESIYKKLVRKNREATLEKALETLHDLAGIRVVCSFQDDVYRVVKRIKKIKKITIYKIKDYIRHPKESGYRSVHIITTIPAVQEKLYLEIQVCSAAMNYWSMLEHQLSYKNTKSDQSEVEAIHGELRKYALEIANIDKQFKKIRKKIEKMK